MIDIEQIKWLSEEYAEKFYKPPYFTVGSQVSQEEYLKLLKDHKSYLCGEMVHTLTWLSSRFNLVNSELADNIYQSILAQSNQEGIKFLPTIKDVKKFSTSSFLNSSQNTTKQMMNDNSTIYRCIPGQLPEDIIPDKFDILNDGRLISPLVRIGNTIEDLFRELPPQSIWLVLERRLQTKNKKRFTWSGKHPLYWKEQ